jgi:hypothetical protein
MKSERLSKIILVGILILAAFLIIRSQSQRENSPQSEINGTQEKKNEKALLAQMTELRNKAKKEALAKIYGADVVQEMLEENQGRFLTIDMQENLIAENGNPKVLTCFLLDVWRNRDAWWSSFQTSYGLIVLRTTKEHVVRLRQYAKSDIFCCCIAVRFSDIQRPAYRVRAVTEDDAGGEAWVSIDSEAGLIMTGELLGFEELEGLEW